MNVYTTIKTLCLCPGISGREDAIRNLIAEKIRAYVDEVRTDALGNLIAVKRGTGEGKRLLLCAHMDEIGFLVTFIEDDGRVRIAPVGGIRWTASANTLVVSEKGTLGVLVAEADAKPADYAAGNFYIDLGARSRREAERRVAIGDFFVCRPDLVKLAGKRIAGRPLDDRVGCAVLLGIAEQMANVEFSGEIAYVFSVQEEVGCRGALPAAFALAPDFALCFDVTLTGDVPGATAMACKLGDGAAVKIKDSSVICHMGVVDTLCRLAKEKGIAHQREILLRGGTDTSSMQLAGGGTRAGALSIPTRYIHSGTEMCDLGDVEACISLGVAFASFTLGA